MLKTTFRKIINKSNLDLFYMAIGSSKQSAFSYYKREGQTGYWVNTIRFLKGYFI